MQELICPKCKSKKINQAWWVCSLCQKEWLGKINTTSCIKRKCESTDIRKTFYKCENCGNEWKVPKYVQDVTPVKPKLLMLASTQVTQHQNASKWRCMRCSTVFSLHGQTKGCPVCGHPHYQLVQ